MRRAVALLLSALLATPCAWAQEQAQGGGRQIASLVVSPVELVELAPPDQRYDEAADAARAQMLGRRIRAALEKSHRYRLIDAGTPPYRYSDCEACLADWARAQGADFALVTWVQKESRLIVMINMALIDVAHPDRPAAGGSIDLRGDTDETWLAGAGQLLDRTVGVQLSP
ncbi:MAG TPA: DUF2380 domain-containing protein [Dyella sp.]|nr:DUF2380 domain-containing protein [Dyella sp.]